MKAMLYSHTRAALFLLAALCVLAAPTLAQSDPSKAAPATVTGRVTDGKRALSGIIITLQPNGPVNRSQNMPSAKTDADGRYRLGGVAPGSYRIMSIAPAHVTTETSEGPFGRALTINPGEAVENIDFRLTRGGVITGRVTGSDGKPIIGEMVQLTPEDNTQPFALMLMARTDRSQLMTDDRGVYRIYGLAAGRYRVSVGTGGARAPRRAGTGSNGTQTFYQRTFYPGVTDEAQAKLVEVTAGSETTDIDITLEKTTRQTYGVAGRLVFAETGQPAASIRVSFAPAGRGGVAGGGFVNFGGGGAGGIVTDARGEFKMEGLASGRYFLFANREGNPDWYSEQVAFEVADADVEGVEVKLRHGASVSGKVQIEGVSDPATAARLLNGVRVFARMNNPGEVPTPDSFPSQAIAPDGSFRFVGLRAGQVTILMSGIENGLMLVRVEQGGVGSPRGNVVEVTEGAQVTGVRIVVAHGTAVVRGQVNVVGGVLPEGWQLMVTARRVGGGDGQSGGGRGSQVDARGRFVVEGLVAGEYEFQATAFAVGGRGGGGPGNRGGGGAGGRIMGVSQRVMVSETGEQSITLVLNLQ